MTGEDFELVVSTPEDGIDILRCLFDCEGPLGTYKAEQYAWRETGGAAIVESPAFDRIADLWYHMRKNRRQS